MVIRGEIDMKIWKEPSLDRAGINLLKKQDDDIKQAQSVFVPKPGEYKPVELNISSEGQEALRKNLNDIKPDVKEDKVLYEITVDDTNEVELEHYFAMSKYGHEELKDGDYTIQDLMQSVADAYESEYNKIIEAHKKGDRKVKYSLTGETMVTLERDLRGLDNAYKRRVDDVQGYIHCLETNDGLKFFTGTNPMEEARRYQRYQEESKAVMEKVRDEFLSSRNQPGGKKGIAKNLVLHFLNENSVLNNAPVLFQKMKRA